MLFSDLALEFQEIEKTSLRNEMMKRLADIIKKADITEVIPLVHLTMGQLRPKFDRLEFNLADKMVVRAIARAYGMASEAVGQEYKKLGDLGEAAFRLAGKSTRQAVRNASTVTEVFSQLEKIAKDNGAGSQERKVEGLSNILTSVGPTGAKYAVRIVLGRLRLGFSDKTILDALSYMESGTKEGREDLDAAYQVAPDVAELSKLVKEMGVKKAREAVRIVLGRPMMPALAQRLRTADEMIEKMGIVEVEPKYDGTRVQIHFSRTKKVETAELPQNGLFAPEENNTLWVKTFTRNLDENTEMFPELQHISEQISADDVIFDSEAVGYDPLSGKMVPFQMTITRKRKHGIEDAVSNVPLRFYVFDILYKDGKSLIELPLRERRTILEETVKKGKILEVDEKIVTGDPQELREFHAKQLLAGLEGALVKKIEGTYLPGRQNWNWVKFKEEEGTAGKLSDTVDAVVMGYYAGKGKRQQFGVGAFLVGVRGTDGQVLTIAKIGTGLSDEQFRDLFTRMEKVTAKHMHTSYAVAKMLTPDVWVIPEIVVEIAADEVTNSPVHSSGYALRFPRLVRFRDDKDPESITTLGELKEIAGV